MIEKATLEHRVTKQFAQIGNRVYEQMSHGRQAPSQDAEIARLIEETRRLDSELAKVEDELARERKK